MVVVRGWPASRPSGQRPAPGRRRRAARTSGAGSCCGCRRPGSGSGAGRRSPPRSRTGRPAPPGDRCRMRRPPRPAPERPRPAGASWLRLSRRLGFGASPGRCTAARCTIVSRWACRASNQPEAARPPRKPLWQTLRAAPATTIIFAVCALVFLVAESVGDTRTERDADPVRRGRSPAGLARRVLAARRRRCSCTSASST